MDGSLLEFQLAEISDSIWSVFCALLFVSGLGLWIHATFFMEGDK
jgi:hypothetical protein